MRVKAATAVTGLLILMNAAALADCARPRPSFEIPDGSSASEQDLAAAQKQLVAHAEQVREYLRCLSGEMSQRAVGKDEAGRAQVNQAHAAAHNEAASELQGLAECLSAQVKAFKSSGGGKEKRAADCASFISAAQSGGQTSAPRVSELVVEASGHSYDVASGRWLYYLARDDKPRRCSPQEAAPECLYRAVHVRNESDEVLECTGEITYAGGGGDSSGSRTSRGQVLVTERTTYVVAEGLAKQGIDAETFDAQCKVRPRLAALQTPADCKYQVIKPIAIGDYYPQAAREAGQAGPVIVEFALSGKAANPTDVRVVSSSMYETLDQAAVKAVGDMVMSSSCGKARYRLKLSFQLEQ